VGSELDPYKELGGEPGVRELVGRFYDAMESRPEAAAIRAMHADDLGEMRERLALYLCGWLGGPRLYDERYGDICMHSTHAPFPIDAAAADEWVACMRAALAETALSDELHAALLAAFKRTAHMLRNDAHALP